MINKNLEINQLLKSVKDENIEGFNIVDFWDSDITAIGLQFGKKLLYISSYNYLDTEKYNIIVENFDTGETIESEKSMDFMNVISKIRELTTTI